MVIPLFSSIQSGGLIMKKNGFTLIELLVVIGIIGFTLDTIVGVLVKKYSWQKDV